MPLLSSLLCPWSLRLPLDTGEQVVALDEQPANFGFGGEDLGVSLLAQALSTLRRSYQS